MKQLTSNSFVLRNCFASDPHTPLATTPKQETSYVSEEKSVDFYEGEKRRFVCLDYPITQDYVRSFVEATDFRNGANVQLKPRQNLGDIRDVQQFASRDSADVQSLVSDLRAKLSALENRLKDSPSPAPTSAPTENPVKEGANNG